MQCDRLYMGTSDISADGGTGGVMYYPIGSSGGGGAGGRVYFALNTVKIASASDISITALGGDTGCASSSNPGTVVTQCSPGILSSPFPSPFPSHKKKRKQILIFYRVLLV